MLMSVEDDDLLYVAASREEIKIVISMVDFGI